MTTDTNLRLSATGLMALVDAYADTAAVNGIRSQWAQMARGNVELALKLRPAPQEHAQPAAVAAPKGLEQIRVGCLTTMNQDDYPGLGGWWVQLRIGSEGDEVLARVYGSSPEQARDRAAALAAVPQAQAEDARDAARYRWIKTAPILLAGGEEHWGSYVPFGTECDTYIDAAIAAQAAKGETQ